MFTKISLCKYFVLLTNVIVTLKNNVFNKTDGYQQICDTNKNMIKMGTIVNGVCYT